jgi:transposase-like protein
MDRGDGFKGRQFTAEVILWAVRWYLMFPISYRDLELMLLDRGVQVDHTTIFRWIQTYAEELEKRIRPHLRMSNGSWRVDETYVRVKGRWMYLYRAVDSRGQTIDFLLAARRDTAAAKRFFRKALAQPHTINPRTLTGDCQEFRVRAGRLNMFRRRPLRNAHRTSRRLGLGHAPLTSWYSPFFLGAVQDQE